MLLNCDLTILVDLVQQPVIYDVITEKQGKRTSSSVKVVESWDGYSASIMQENRLILVFKVAAGVAKVYGRSNHEAFRLTPSKVRLFGGSKFQELFEFIVLGFEHEVPPGQSVRTLEGNGLNDKYQVMKIRVLGADQKPCSIELTSWIHKTTPESSRNIHYIYASFSTGMTIVGTRR